MSWGLNSLRVLSEGCDKIRLVNNWVKGQSQRVVVNGVTSGKKTSSVPWGSVLGTVLFNVFINGLDTEVECTQNKFIIQTKLGGPVDSREPLQRHLEKLECWTITSPMKFNKDKRWILHLDQV